MMAPATRYTRLPRPMMAPARNGNMGMPTAPEASVSNLNGTGTKPPTSKNQKPFSAAILRTSSNLSIKFKFCNTGSTK